MTIIIQENRRGHDNISNICNPVWLYLGANTDLKSNLNREGLRFSNSQEVLLYILISLGITG